MISRLVYSCVCGFRCPSGGARHGAVVEVPDQEAARDVGLVDLAVVPVRGPVAAELQRRRGRAARGRRTRSPSRSPGRVKSSDRRCPTGRSRAPGCRRAWSGTTLKLCSVQFSVAVCGRGSVHLPISVPVARRRRRTTSCRPSARRAVGSAERRSPGSAPRCRRPARGRRSASRRPTRTRPSGRSLTPWPSDLRCRGTGAVSDAAVLAAEAPHGEAVAAGAGRLQRVAEDDRRCHGSESVGVAPRCRPADRSRPRPPGAAQRDLDDVDPVAGAARRRAVDHAGGRSRRPGRPTRCASRTAGRPTRRGPGSPGSLMSKTCRPSKPTGTGRRRRSRRRGGSVLFESQDADQDVAPDHHVALAEPCAVRVVEDRGGSVAGRRCR